MTFHPPFTCPTCGELVPGCDPTLVRAGRPIRECRHCGHQVDLDEVIA